LPPATSPASTASPRSPDLARRARLVRRALGLHRFTA
jgi:hypothetical protein